MKLMFRGAAGEVTGSCASVEAPCGPFLVDCGMFQGGRNAPRRNLAALGFDLRAVRFVLITHAHLDHSGLIPRLVALGYKGPIYATPATVDLLEVMLLDAAHIQEKEAEWATRNARKRQRKRFTNAVPLYTVEQARASLARLRAVDYGVSFSPGDGVTCTFHDAGHILGSAILEADVRGIQGSCRLVFTGDLGQPERPVLRDPARVDHADVLVVESTYGDRAHRPMVETENELVGILESTLERRRGNVIIPAFAVGRTQEVIFVLARLVREGRVRPLQIVVDSPMALAATELTLRHDALWDEETRDLLRWMRAHPERLGLRFVRDVEESMALNTVESGLVIISASGMCEAGRIKHHLRYNIAREQASIVICGFQAGGTLGRRLVDGARWVTLFGERLPVRASVHTIGGLSAHADQPALLDWLAHLVQPPRQTFVVHGERQASVALSAAIETRLRWKNVIIPEPDTDYALQFPRTG